METVVSENLERFRRVAKYNRVTLPEAGLLTPKEEISFLQDALNGQTAGGPQNQVYYTENGGVSWIISENLSAGEIRDLSSAWRSSRPCRESLRKMEFRMGRKWVRSSSFSTRVNSSSNWSTTSSNWLGSPLPDGRIRFKVRISPRSSFSRGSNKLAGGSTDTGSRPASSSSMGFSPGAISTMNHFSEPGKAPFRIAGIIPAFTAEDLPDPLGPTTARKLA